MAPKKTDRGFIVRVREQIINLEVSNDYYKLPKTGVKNLSEFCRIVNLDYNTVSREIGHAKDNDSSMCEIGNWTFTWMTIDQFRDHLESFKIPMNVRMMWIRGRVPTEVKNFPAADRPFGKLLLDFING